MNLRELRDKLDLLEEAAEALGKIDDWWHAVYIDPKTFAKEDEGYELWRRGDNSTVLYIPMSNDYDAKEIAEYLDLAQPRVVATLVAFAANQRKVVSALHNRVTALEEIAELVESHDPGEEIQALIDSYRNGGYDSDEIEEAD